MVNDEYVWFILLGNVWWLMLEFFCLMWGLGVFIFVFLVEEIVFGLCVVSYG